MVKVRSRIGLGLVKVMFCEQSEKLNLNFKSLQADYPNKPADIIIGMNSITEAEQNLLHVQVDSTFC